MALGLDQAKCYTLSISARLGNEEPESSPPSSSYFDELLDEKGQLNVDYVNEQIESLDNEWQQAKTNLEPVSKKLQETQAYKDTVGKTQAFYGNVYKKVTDSVSDAVKQYQLNERLKTAGILALPVVTGLGLLDIYTQNQRMAIATEEGVKKQYETWLY
jgi:hypothetical protein